MNYLSLLPDSAHTDAIIREHMKRQDWIKQDKKGFLRYRDPYNQLTEYSASYVDCTGDTVIIGQPDEISVIQRQQITENLRAFIPWRKGPFSVFGVDIDAEWRSERKWQRLLPELPDLSGKTIADIGCNNGYYMFRMAGSRPRLVLGFEPSVQHYYCFKALNSMAGIAGAEYRPAWCRTSQLF